MFLEQAVGVGGQHFRPLITVITGRIAAGEDVREALREAVEFGRDQHRHFGAYFVEKLQYGFTLARIKAAVHQHVEQGEFDLAQRGQSALEILRGEHLVEQGARQWFMGIDMPGHALQHLPLPAKILHELAGQLHRIPLHTVDARHAEVFHFSQQMMQAVAELVEQRLHFIVREQRRFITHRGRKVAIQIGDRRLDLVAQAPPRDHVVHPGTAALAVARVKIKVELADQIVIRIADVEEAHGLMPHRRVGHLDAQAVQRFHQLEQTSQHGIFGEILLHLLFGKSVALLAQFFAGVGNIPRVQLVQTQAGSGKFAQFSQVFFRKRARALRQFAHEIGHLLRGLRHLGRQRQLAVVGKAEQRRFLRAQRDDLVHQRRIVPLRLAEFRSARGVSAIHFFAQLALIGELHDRHIGGRFQGEQPAGPFDCAQDRLAGSSGRFTRGLQHVFRQSAQLAALFQHQREGVGRVEQVVGEA